MCNFVSLSVITLASVGFFVVIEKAFKYFQLCFLVIFEVPSLKTVCRVLKTKNFMALARHLLIIMKPSLQRDSSVCSYLGVPGDLFPMKFGLCLPCILFHLGKPTT
jgi:hypothetical protein